MDENLMPLSRAAKRCGVSAAWLRKEAEAGRVPCLPVGNGRFLFDSIALVESLRERARTPISHEVANV